MPILEISLKWLHGQLLDKPFVERVDRTNPYLEKIKI